jgi:hypothetical protein
MRRELPRDLLAIESATPEVGFNSATISISNPASKSNEAFQTHKSDPREL